MKKIKLLVGKAAALLLAVCVTAQAGGLSAVTAYAAKTPEEPVVQAQGAVVINAADGQILYGKNAGNRYYPASITKLMTALLTIENCSLDDTVTFSRTATTGMEAGAVSLGLVEGDTLTVRQCLYGLLLKSANEIGNGLAEHISGSVSKFADLMNQKAASLGCTGTHFANPHGLNNSEHYTTPYDMALIARAAFANPTLCTIDSTLTYRFPATKECEARTITMGHKMLFPTDSRYYEGIIGGKTGYTSLAGNTLVTAAERDGVRLIAVVMKANGTHYTDTRALLDYGFSVMASRGSAGAGPSVQETSAAETSGSSGESDPAAGAAGPGAAPTETTSAAPSSGGTPATPPRTTGWFENETGWFYVKADGSYARGEWLDLDGVRYWIDPDGYMATGWRQFTNGDWYYFGKSSGAMSTNRWVEDNGKWFYLGSQGTLLKDTVTPDGYTLGADGAWIQ